MFPDFVEFVACLNAHRVKYLVIGGYAVAFHARPRATKDVDLLIEPSPSNAKRTLAAVREFLGSAPPELTVEKLTNPRTVFVLGRAPVRIDILTSLEGLSFRDAWRRRAKGRFGDATTSYLSLPDLILVKEIAGRPQDKADVAVLKVALARRARARPARPRAGGG